MRTRGLLLIAAVLLGGLAGCGDDDVAAGNAYVARVNAVQDRFQRDANAVQASIRSATATPAQNRRALDRFATAVTRAVSQLGEITPPRRLAALHRALIAALARYGPVIAARRAAEDATDPRRLIAARTRFSTASDAVNQRVQQAISRLNARLAAN